MAPLEAQLLSILAGYDRVAVAFSAGIDSTLVAAAAYRACGDRAVAVTAVSPSLPSGEREAARELAAAIGIRHREIFTQELGRAEYVQNPTNRCFYCKTELYQTLLSIAPTLEVDVLVNGANLDDLGDHRPGMQAAQDFQVRSPLIEAGFRKADVRELARRWNLPNWDKAASPCLSSRIAYGVEVTPARLDRIDKAELWLKQALRVAELRVRCEANDAARVEVPVTALPALVASPLREQMVAHLRELGFRRVTLDLEGFRSGSLNAAVPVVDLQIPAHSLSPRT